jgi:hypothetical protein
MVVHPKFKWQELLGNKSIISEDILTNMPFPGNLSSTL